MFFEYCLILEVFIYDSVLFADVYHLILFYVEIGD